MFHPRSVNYGQTRQKRIVISQNKKYENKINVRSGHTGRRTRLLDGGWNR
jgi:hypothetical protein